MVMRAPPEKATCAVCMKRTVCVTKRTMYDGEVRSYDNFKYSEVHRGWLCRKCTKILDESPEPKDFLRYIETSATHDTRPHS